jgi:hypothetical protein
VGNHAPCLRIGHELDERDRHVATAALRVAEHAPALTTGDAEDVEDWARQRTELRQIDGGK